MTLLAASLKDPAVNSDLPGYARVELAAIQELVRGGLGKVTPEDGPVQPHLKDLFARIQDALEPGKPR